MSVRLRSREGLDVATVERLWKTNWLVRDNSVTKGGGRTTSENDMLGHDVYAGRR
jgi:hypothetical protein